MTKKLDRFITINLFLLSAYVVVLIANEMYAFYINIQGCGI